MYNFDLPAERLNTRSVKWDAVNYDTIPMWIADMDFPAPPAVLKDLSVSLEHGILGYSNAHHMPGIICNWLLEEFNVHAEKDWIILLPAIIPPARAVSQLREGKIMMHVPNYPGLLRAPPKAGKETILSPLKNTDEFYEMDLTDMEKRIENDTRIFFLCNPHNPVGRVYTKNELLELNEFAKKNKLIILSDEVHCGLVFDRPHIPYFSVDDYARENSITLIGNAKTYNLPGLPLGFAVIPNETLREDFLKLCYTLPEPGIMNLIAAEAAFTKSREWKNALIEHLRGNRDYLENRLKTSFPKIKLTHVEGSYLQWIDFRPLGISNPNEWLLEKPKIMASDGIIFGVDGYVRINFGTTRARLKEALDRIENCLST